MSKILERAILAQVPGAENPHFEGDHVFVGIGDEVIRYRLSTEGSGSPC